MSVQCRNCEEVKARGCLHHHVLQPMLPLQGNYGLAKCEFWLRPRTGEKLLPTWHWIECLPYCVSCRPRLVSKLEVVICITVELTCFAWQMYSDGALWARLQSLQNWGTANHIPGLMPRPADGRSNVLFLLFNVLSNLAWLQLVKQYFQAVEGFATPFSLTEVRRTMSVRLLSRQESDFCLGRQILACQRMLPARLLIFSFLCCSCISVITARLLIHKSHGTQHPSASLLTSLSHSSHFI